MNPAIEKSRLRIRSVVSREGVECKYDVIDLHEQTVEYLKTAALLFEATLPRNESVVHVYSYWREPTDNRTAAISRVINYWPKPSNPKLLLGIPVDDNDLNQSSRITYAPLTYDPGQSSHTPYDSFTSQPSKEDRSVRWTDDMITENNKNELKRLIREEMGWKDWDWDLEKKTPAMAHWCMCRWPYATYQALPCKHAYVCDACFGDFEKHPNLRRICPKCLSATSGNEPISTPGPGYVHKNTLSNSLLNILEDDDVMDLEYYQSSEDDDDEKNVPYIEYEDEKGMY
jgi:hypothetical protein